MNIIVLLTLLFPYPFVFTNTTNILPISSTTAKRTTAAIRSTLSVQNMILRKGRGMGYIQCQATCIGKRVFLTSATCLFDDWGNFLGSPRTFAIVNSSGNHANVTKMYIHPHFWLTSTQNNIAILYTTVFNGNKDARACKLPTQDFETIDGELMYNDVVNLQKHSFESRIMDKEQYCVRQDYPLAMRLRHDNLCATIPRFPNPENIHRRYSGTPFVAKDTLYAILSFNYRCENIIPVAVFTKVSSHLKFIENPKKFIADEVIIAKKQMKKEWSFSTACHFSVINGYFLLCILYLFL